jgi:hypothetical protein
MPGNRRCSHADGDGRLFACDFHDTYGGCRAAVDEFLADHGHLFTTDKGENFALTRK